MIVQYKNTNNQLEKMKMELRWKNCMYTLGTQDLKNTGVSYNFLSFYSVILKLGTKKELVIL